LLQFHIGGYHSAPNHLLNSEEHGGEVSSDFSTDGAAAAAAAASVVNLLHLSTATDVDKQEM